MKHTRTFKIGEYCAGGVITVEITGKVIVVIQKDWDTSTGYTKKSSQKNAEELSRGTVESTDPHAEQKLTDFLMVITTSHWTGEVLAWIKSKVKLKEESMW